MRQDCDILSSPDGETQRKREREIFLNLDNDRDSLNRIIAKL